MASRETAMATQKTPQEAAALIQARVRGYHQRTKQSRAIKAITKLQARQRGRYTRREYQKLLEFYNEQESFLAESKRRQLRLWHREQELYFLQHTTADELDRIRQFQYDKSARRIQREWKRLHPTPLEDVDVSGLGKPFDPFGLLSEPGGSMSTTGRATNRDAVAKELYGELPRSVPVSQDAEKLARRRAEIQDKLKSRRKNEEKQNKEKMKTEEKTTRRELFNTLVELRQDTARRLQETSEQHRKSRGKRDLAAAQLSASCRNRLAFLQDETRIQTLLDTSKRAAFQEQIACERRRFEDDTATWGDDRKREAWESHSRILQSVLGKTQWHETFIAGEKRDIRRVFAESPWEHERQVWQWPPQAKATEEVSKDSGGKSTRATAMDRFMFGLSEGGDENSPENEGEDAGIERPELMADELASRWWRAHATQSHFSYARLQQKRQQRERRRLTGNNYGTEDAQVTPEMLANPRFYELYKQTIAENREKELTQSVDARFARLQRQIQQKVVEIETQIDVNTRVILEKASLAQQQQARKLKEESATIQIQRTVRGKLGRKRAQEHLAQFFVMVRGRAIRKGKCEECGEAQAVLECKQCEESLQFCPVCWVQVHSTRRRKTHVAIPMAVDVSTQESKPTKTRKQGGLGVDIFSMSARGPVVSALTLDSMSSLPGSAAQGIRSPQDTVTSQKPGVVASSGLKPDAGVSATESQKTTRPAKASSAIVDATKSSVEAKPRARQPTTITSAVDQPLPQPSAVQSDISAPEKKPAAATSASPVPAIEAATKPQGHSIAAATNEHPKPTEAHPTTDEKVEVVNTEAAESQKPKDTSTSTTCSGKLARPQAVRADGDGEDAVLASEKLKPTQPLEQESATSASDTAPQTATPEPETPKPTPQPRGPLTKAGGDHAAAPRPSLRERMAKEQAKPSTQAVEIVETAGTKPKDDKPARGTAIIIKSGEESAQKRDSNDSKSAE